MNYRKAICQAVRERDGRNEAGNMYELAREIGYDILRVFRDYWQELAKLGAKMARKGKLNTQLADYRNNPERFKLDFLAELMDNYSMSRESACKVFSAVYP